MGTGRRTRRVGVLHLVPAAGGMAGAGGVAFRFELPVAETVAALLPSVGGLYLSWAAFRADRRDVADGYDMPRIADRLAVAVRGQWESEARVRRLNDPYPLPVSWRAADPGFGESWPLLREMAGERPSGRSAPPSGWATGPAGLAGTGAEITEVFLERVPTRRLVVRAEPGAPRRRAWDWRMCALGFTAGAVLWFSFRLNYGPAAAAVGALANGTVYALAGGAVGARASSLSARRPDAIPTVRTRWAWDWRGFSVGLASGSTIGLTHWAVLRIQSLLTGTPSYTFTTMLSFSCAFGLAVGIAHGLAGKPADLATSVGPAALLEQDRRIFRRLWTVVGLAVCAAFLLCYGVEYVAQGGLHYGLGRGTTGGKAISMSPPHILVRGLAYGLTVGLAAALGHNAWWHCTLTRHHLAARRDPPGSDRLPHRRP
ncbi:hypothetical protein [Streptomyces odonnellii]|uniref:hypothetical protein n=1 Tax=Streptomyces odonnellii TaxID=1417980 RepID=UPI0018E3F370|nr:hypothetical protein [Streptomyces odonnellii]